MGIGMSKNSPEYNRMYNEKQKKEHPEKKAEYNRTYYLKNSKRIVSRVSEWRKNNPDKRKLQTLKRNHLVRNGSSFPLEQWLEKLKSLGNRCVSCGTENNIEVDHIIPTSKGGTNDINNLQPLCRHCNATKFREVIDYRKGGE
jgi:5-methylcytosine-specific restriction endonuclease McrA